MRFLSVCSGIEAASVAWAPLGWSAVAFSEIEPFPCAVLAHHYPDVPNWGDMTKFKEWPDASVDLLCGGTPCQSFSVAGLRKGLDDPRGNLMLTFGAIAGRYRPRWLVWENVPGVLSSNGGRDFGAFLGMLGELGYGVAYRVLDAQYFGVAQRRRRVFVVGYLGDWRRAAAVLFERHSLSGDPAPSRETRKDVAPTLSARTQGGGGLGTDFDCDGGCVPVAPTLRAGGNRTGGDRPPGTDVDTADSLIVSRPQPHTTISPAIKARDYKGVSSDGDGDGAVLVPMAFDTTQITSRANYSNPRPGDPCHPLAAGAHAPAIAFDSRQDPVSDEHVFGALGSSSPQAQAVAYAIQAGALRENPNSGPDGLGVQVDNAYTLEARAEVQAVATLAIRGRDGKLDLEVRHDGTANALLTPSGGRAGIGVGAIHYDMSVRRLTPEECEALQAFPRNYTRIAWRNRAPDQCPDGPRYKALGNSWCTAVARWIGERIEQVELLEVA